MNDNERIRMKVTGISANAVTTDAYALLLTESEGDKTIPVIVGQAEAQSILVALKHVEMPRPLAHDMFISSLKAFGIRIENVMIYKFERGIFYSEICMRDTYNDNREVVIDSRTSDAVALAMRCHAPIFASSDVVDATGVVLEQFKKNENDSDNEEDVDLVELPLE
ncbi:MAG: bifunctional nuclease family protein, partial [Muribaculaceae bacterium]|nr:bifunctional nuclease family protein [Muribaculaceae bacterium]